MHVIQKKHIVLSALYNLRCLSYNQIYQYAYKEYSEKGYIKHISAFIKEGIIEKIGYYNKDSYFQITAKGIKLLKSQGIIPLDKNKHDIALKTSILPASSVVLKENNINHQLALNQFILDFIDRYPDVEFEYYDEKYMSNIFTDIRPDGLLKTKDCLYFLEMDMNTERKSRLIKKWESYRSFIHSEDYYSTCNQDIKVLFILEQIGARSPRKYTLQNYIDVNLRSDICSRFNLYIDTSSNLFNLLDKDIKKVNNGIDTVLASKGFSVVDGNFSAPELSEFSFGKYAYKPDANNKITIENNYTLDFIIEDYTDCNMYTYKKVILYPKINTLYRHTYNRDIKYIVVVNNMTDAHNLLKQTNAYNDGIFFVTLDRLKKFTFHSSLFTIGRSNNIVYHFLDGNLRVKQEENFLNAYL